MQLRAIDQPIHRDEAALGSEDAWPHGDDYPLGDLDLCRPIRILFVDDDPALRHMVADYLMDHNMHVSSVFRAQDALQQLAAEQPGMVILDLGFGQEDGLNVLREVRKRSDVPVIITTDHRSNEIDRVIGLELGADHHITKPFGLRELLARIKAVLRSQGWGKLARQRTAERGLCRFGSWVLDRGTRRLTAPDGTAVALTKGEHTLLVAFLNAPQRPLTREHLLQATRMHEDVFDRSIDVQVLRLRRKLETDPSMARVIQTERGVGYVFALAVEPP
jgi:two-component system OmpR family response regulator